MTKRSVGRNTECWGVQPSVAVRAQERPSAGEAGHRFRMVSEITVQSRKASHAMRRFSKLAVMSIATVTARSSLCLLDKVFRTNDPDAKLRSNKEVAVRGLARRLERRRSLERAWLQFAAPKSMAGRCPAVPYDLRRVTGQMMFTPARRVFTAAYYGRVSVPVFECASRGLLKFENGGIRKMKRRVHESAERLMIPRALPNAPRQPTGFLPFVWESRCSWLVICFREVGESSRGDVKTQSGPKPREYHCSRSTW